MRSSCARRGALQFTAEGEAVVLSDHQVGKVGPYGVHVGSVIDSVSSGTGCDGGTNATHDFLIVHSPA